MGIVRRKPAVVTAARWFKNGDHPEDGDPTQEGKAVRYFRHPDIPGHAKCGHCANVMNDHGWIDAPDGGRTVCPGDVIITGVTGERFPCKPDAFERDYDLAAPKDHVDTIQMDQHLTDELETLLETRHPSVAHVLQYFAFMHLPPHLRKVSIQLADLAVTLCRALPDGIELTVALRKLLESKDAAVRAALPDRTR